MGIPRTFNKRQLCYFLGLIRERKGANGKPEMVILYRELKRDFMTPDVLEKIGVDESEYKKIRIFKAPMAKILIEEFDLKDGDWEG